MRHMVFFFTLYLLACLFVTGILGLIVAVFLAKDKTKLSMIDILINGTIVSLLHYLLTTTIILSSPFDPIAYYLIAFFVIYLLTINHPNTSRKKAILMAALFPLAPIIYSSITYPLTLITL